MHSWQARICLLTITDGKQVKLSINYSVPFEALKKLLALRATVAQGLKGLVLHCAGTLLSGHMRCDQGHLTWGLLPSNICKYEHHVSLWYVSAFTAVHAVATATACAASLPQQMSDAACIAEMTASKSCNTPWNSKSRQL